MKPRVLQLTNVLARAGAETQVVRIALGLRARGWDVAVASMMKPTAFETELGDGGVPVYSLDMTPGKPSVRSLVEFVRLLRSLRPQILHSHLFHANLLARASRLVCPVPVNISTVHSMAESSRKTGRIRARDRLYRLTEPLSDIMIAVSQAAAKRHIEAKAAHSAKMKVVPNAVDTALYRPDNTRRQRLRRELRAGDKFVWLAAGRLMWKKDPDTLLRAFAKVKGGILLIAGEGPEEERLRVTAAETGKDVRFLGMREDISALMNAADGFVLSSVVEGLPLVLLEAAASGLPAVATDVGGVGEAVVNERTGLVVPARDVPALAKAMDFLASLPNDARESLAREARKHALARFDSEVVMRQWENLYLDLLETV